MDAVIRAALLAPFRTRLSEAGPRPNSPPTTGGGTRNDKEAGAQALRAEIEREVRSEMLAQMEKVYSAECERARADGYADGVAEAKDVVVKENAEVRQQLQSAAESAITALERAHAAALAELQASVGEIAFAAVCRLSGEQATSKAYVLGLVDQVCAQLRGDMMATVRLHPRDVATLQELLQVDGLHIRSLDLKVVPDDSLKLGGCVVEAASGRYDGGLEGQLHRLHALLTGKE